MVVGAWEERGQGEGRRGKEWWCPAACGLAVFPNDLTDPFSRPLEERLVGLPTRGERLADLFTIQGKIGDEFSVVSCLAVFRLASRGG